MKEYFNFKDIRKDKGQAVIVSVIFFVIISLALISGGTLPTGNQIKNSNDFFKSKQSYAAADSVNDNAFYMVGKGYSISTGISLPFSNVGVTATATVTDLTNKKQIITTGISTSAVRVSKIIISQNFGTNFNYGVQSGTGGITMTNASITGDLYSIGNISGDTGSTVTGTTTVAYQSPTNVGKIIGSSNSQYNPLKIKGNAWAHDIEYTKVSSGTGYCQTSNYLLNSSGNPVNCASKSGDPAILNFPITATNITNWKNAVTSQTDSGINTHSGGWNIESEDSNTSVNKVLGDLSCSDGMHPNFGNLYVVGNLSISGSCIISTGALHVGGKLTISGSGILNLGGMSYVVGSINISGGGEVKLDSSLGSNTGYLISDGLMTISGGGALSGSGITVGTNSSYIMMITTSNSNSAISISGGGSAALLVAPYGKVSFSNGSLNGIVAKTVDISGGTLTYQSYLGGMVFGGPASGPWNVLDWREVSN